MQRKSTLRVVAAAAVIVTLSIFGGMAGARLSQPKETTVVLQSEAIRPLPAAFADTQDATTLPNSTAVTLAFQDRFREVAGATLPVVVEINVARRVEQPVQATPFEFFFRQPNQSAPEPREQVQRGMGSGVIIGHDGVTAYVITNDHVAGDADEIEVVLNDGREFAAQIVGSDPLMDIALLSFQTSEDVPIATLGASADLLPGDWVFAVGNPLGFESTVTAGIVSAVARQAESGSMSGVTDYIQTDAAINRGNSGGALVNLNGEVVGINTWIASQTGGSIGLGFAIPIDAARRAVEDILATGEVTYGWLGVTIGSVDAEFAALMGLGQEAGAFISGVYEGGPAALSGLRPGDVITRVGETDIPDSQTLVRTVATIRPGVETEFDLVRNGNEITVTVRTGRRNQEALQSATLWPGINVFPITQEAREQLSLDDRTSGVIVAGVVGTSPAAASGIRTGDTILSVNGRPVANPMEFYTALAEQSEEEVSFRVIRAGRVLVLGFVRSAA